MKKVALCVSNGAWLHKELLSQTWRLHVLGVLKHELSYIFFCTLLERNSTYLLSQKLTNNPGLFWGDMGKHF